jgi:hypothetical protein
VEFASADSAELCLAAAAAPDSPGVEPVALARAEPDWPEAEWVAPVPVDSDSVVVLAPVLVAFLVAPLLGLPALPQAELRAFVRVLHAAGAQPRRHLRHLCHLDRRGLHKCLSTAEKARALLGE